MGLALLLSLRLSLQPRKYKSFPMVNLGKTGHFRNKNIVKNSYEAKNLNNLQCFAQWKILECFKFHISLEFKMSSLLFSYFKTLC